MYNTPYMFTVTAMNSVGWSIPSKQYTTSTLALKPAAPPKPVMEKKPSSSSVTVIYTIPNGRGLPVTSLQTEVCY